MFLPKDLVARAQSDRSGDPRSEILLRLNRACDAHLRLTPNSLVKLRGKSFVRWRAVIEELSAMAALSPGGAHLERLVECVAPMARGGWRMGSGFDRHLAVPWVLTALAGCLDAHDDQLGSGKSVVEDIVAEFSEFISREQETTSWGDVERVAFNHTIIAYAALGAGALALLGKHPDASGWLERALDATERFLAVGVSSAGMTYEGLTYCGYDFKYVGVLLTGLQARGLATNLVPPDSTIEQKLRRVPTWYAHDMWPSGSRLQNFNDSFYEPDRAVWGLLIMFGAYEPDLCASIWDRLVGSKGTRNYGAHHLWSSLAEAMFFYPQAARENRIEQLETVFVDPDVGYLSARDGWREDATVFSFNSGPFLKRARVHDQADNNSFTLIARGAPMVLDSGDGNDRREGSPSSSLGHNLVLIDGRGEHPAGDGLGVSGRIVAFASGEDVVSVVGDATESYCQEKYNSIRHFFRTTVFVRKPFPYVLIFDEIDKDGQSHFYEFIVHVPEIDEPSLVGGSREARICDPAGQAIGVIEVLRPAELSPSVETFETKTQPFREHRLLRFGTHAVEPGFLVLLRPVSPTPERPVVQVDESVDGLSVSLQWTSTLDRITLPRAASTAPNSGTRLPTMTRSMSGHEPLMWDRMEVDATMRRRSKGRFRRRRRTT